MEHLNAAALAVARGAATDAAGALDRCEALPGEAGIELDPDDRFELDVLRARLTD